MYISHLTELMNAFQLKKFPTTERTFRAPSTKIKASFVKQFQDAATEYRKQMFTDGGIQRSSSANNISSEQSISSSQTSVSSSVSSIHLVRTNVVKYINKNDK